MLKNPLVLFLFVLNLFGCIEHQCARDTEISKQTSKKSLLPIESFVKVEQIVFKGKEALDSYSGSGSIVKTEEDTTFVLTAKHLCSFELDLVAVGEVKPTSQQMFIYDLENVIHEATIINKSETYDFCILQVDSDLKRPAISLSKSPPTLAERVFNIAAPVGIFGKHMVPMYQGFYSGNFEISPGVEMSGFSIPTQTGSSGSPIFNEDMELISIILRKTKDFENFAIGGTHQQLKEYLASNLNI